MSPTTLVSTVKRFMLLKGLVVFVLCSSFVLPQVFAPWVAKASSNPVPTSAPPEAFLLPRTSTATNSLIGSFVTAGNSIREVINGPVLPEGFEMARPPSFTERLGSTMASMIGINTAPSLASPPQPNGSVDFDFDNDGKADIGRWHSSTTEFKVQNSNGGAVSTYTIGSSTAKSVPGDFDGDGKTDAAVFNAGTWTIRKSSTGTTQTINFGVSSDIPVTGDYDGDGTSDAAIYRPSTGTWWVLNSSNGASPATAFGVSTDIPVPGNYDGDTKTDLAVFRPSTGEWHILGSTSGYSVFQWGVASDTPVPADYDGDGKTDCAVYRGSAGTWYAYKSSASGQYFTQAWGNYGDQPVPADYDGDGKADFAVWRPTNGVWYTIKSSNGAYDYKTLGMAGDTAVSSSYLKQIGGQIFGYSLAKARLSPKNSTGGTDLYSRNFSWGSSLVGLPGRAGLDAGFGISYNSLVWTKDGSAIYFDTNQDNVSPGFRLGFSTIEPVYYDSVTQKWNYLMVTPSGGRIEFRQTGASNTYETADSSYVQLVTKGAPSPNSPVENISMTVTGTDGTQMNYEWKGGAFRCSEIKDRNGNFITINHDDQGILRTVTDTLGRVITVNYDGGLYPTSITQTWKDDNGHGSDVTHIWASFAYTTKEINTSFTGITDNFGPPNGTILKVLERVTYTDGSSTRFTHNSYGQVWKVQNYAPDGINELNSVSTDLQSPPSSQPDCPKFSQTITYVQNFNGGTPTTVNNTLDTGQTYSVGGVSGTGTRIQVWMSGHPDNLRTNTFVGESGWLEGLPLATEDCITTSATCSDRKRWTWTNWTQDDPNLGHILNPRAIESKVGDTTNTKRSTVEYLLYPSTTIAEYGLVSAVNIYDTNQTTVFKRSETDYNLSSTYLAKRIIGLPSEVRAYGYENGSLPLVSKMTYLYDEGNFNDSTISQNISPVQHDDTNYSASFVIGRGNLTSTTRWNVEYPTSSSYAVASSLKYNTAGASVSQTSPWDGTNTRTVKFGYADNFNSTVSNATYAYLTSITDPANVTSTIKYRYDIGTNVEASNPPPDGQTYGKTTKRIYDGIGRLQRNSVFVGTTEKSYVRYQFPDNGVQSQIYAPIVDVNGNGNIAEDEVYSEGWSDGAGRPLANRTEHPGSFGGWSATRVEYDILGRVAKQSVPTEISVSGSTWTPTGDDSTWRWTYQKYDWKGRVVRKINTDGVDQGTLNDTDVLISYAGCGCAGGVETTIETERVPIPGTSNFARRKQKSYSDVLGRTFKTETFEWDGTTVYSTLLQTFNGRDQVTLARQYAGNTSSTTFQDTTAAFDGHGRMISSHAPEQRDSSNNLKNTTYNYNPDDSILSVTDGRAAVTNFQYNSRALLTQKSWTVPTGSNIPDPTDVIFTYDNLGNRISMTDGLGEVDYEYNSLSQMTAETRDFTDTLNDAPVGGVYRIEYGYGLTGELRSLTEPFGKVINYSNDKAGRLTSVDPAVAYGDLPANSAVISGMKYRAFGSLKQADYGNGTQATISYNNRLQPSAYRLVNTSNSQVLFGKDYFYTTDSNSDNDGRLKRSVHIDDTLSTTDEEKQNRYYTYDSVGRVKTAEAGEPACYSFGCVSRNGPFRQTYHYNPFEEQTQIDDWDFGFNTPGGGPGCYGCPRWSIYSETITNGRTSSSTLSTNDPAGGQSISVYEYDNDGRMTKRGEVLYSNNAAGLLQEIDPAGTDPNLTYAHDGYGETVKWSEGGTPKNYYIKSTLLDKTLLDLSPSGGLEASYILAPNGAELASLRGNFLTLKHRDPASENLYSIMMDRFTTNATYDPTGRVPSLTSPGGPCLPSAGCIGPAGVGGMYGGFDGLEMLTRWRNGEWLRTNQFFLIDMAIRQSNTPIGIRDRGVSWGTPFTATYEFDGSRTYEFGEYDPDLWNVNYSNTSLLYGVDWSVSVLLTSLMVTQRQTSRYPPFKKGDQKAVKEGLERAKGIAKKKECDEALKDFGIPSVAKLLEGVDIEGSDANTFDGRTSSLIISKDSKGKPKTIAQYFEERETTVGAAVFWNLGPTKQNVMFVGEYYFNPPNVENLGMQRAFILMHEAVHLIGTKSDAHFGGSKKLSEKLIEKCFPVLKGKLGGVG